ncbi:hypothetical protein EW026_g5449 [Hermanssonia centrifuga]|uniref:Uncharacterized protein n=1 Tax=Hermanssonia centrifuga TaxID=98765 RepID=A0A4S4KE27_9APHY|nr:hypothetical protein EW026_g5449 [Hermanssonia centrifuga]
MDLAFTADGGYFLIHPMEKKFRWRGVPQSLQERMELTGPEKVIAIHCITFGEDGAFFMGWSRADGKEQTWAVLKGQYPSLEKWLNEPNRRGSAKKLYIVLGLPPSLSEKIREFRVNGLNVRRIQLGINGCYFVEASDGSRAWNVTDDYPDLRTHLNKQRLTKISTVNLSPYDSQHFFIAFNDGHAKWTLPASWVSDISAVAREYRRHKAVSSGSTLSQTNRPENQQRKPNSSSSSSGPIRDLELTRKIISTVGTVVTAGITVASAVGCTIM